MNCIRAAAWASTLTLIVVRSVSAQTDFYNTDRGRPIQIEDAYATERYALELKLAPVRLERSDAALYRWGVEPEIAYGILPRTHIEVGVPLSYSELGTQKRSGVMGIDVSLLHNFNIETRTLPALAVRADLLAPVGNLAPAHPYATFTGLATRTFRWARFHVNGQYTAGPNGDRTATPTDIAAAGSAELSRWLAGVAVDKTYPLKSLLVTAALYARAPLSARAAAAPEWNAGTGARYQMNPTLALDAGFGRRLNGDDRGWYVTFGTAYAFGIAALFPGRTQ